MLTRVIREMQLSLISMLTRSQRVLRIYKSTVNRFRKWLPLPACPDAARIASALLTEVQTLWRALAVAALDGRGALTRRGARRLRR